MLAALAAALLPAAASADILEEVAVSAVRADAVIRITFAAPVQYLRHEVFGDAFVEIYFRPLTAERPALTEARRLKATAGFPAVEVVYPLQPHAPTRKLIVRLSGPLKPLRVRPAEDHVLELVVPGGARLLEPALAAAPTPPPAPKPPPVPKLPAPAVKPPPEPGRFVVRLASFPSVEAMKAASPVPGEFAQFDVIVSRVQRDGRTEYDLVLGYFPSAEAARRAAERLRGRFPLAQAVDLRAPPPALAVAPPEPAPPAAVAPPTVAAEEVEARAAQLMAAARAALDAGRTGEAIDGLNRLLLLPPNRQSEPAQELVGLARERAGETAKARAEYELYLKLYPRGEGAARVRSRLAALEKAPAAAAAPRRERPPLKMVTGSLAQYYYGGRIKVETAFNTPTTVDRASFTAIDQSALVTNFDLMYRNRDADGDSRMVLRDTDSHSFLDTQRSYNRLTAAYYDYRGLQHPFSTRLGRQTGLSGGLPQRFDGALAGYGIAPKWRVSAAAGVPVEYPEIDADRRFMGASLDYEGLAGAWSGNFFALEQRSDSLLDRRAVGAELRYFRGGASLFALADYDTSYKAWNVGMLQGTWQTEGRTTINFLYDKRKAPTLTTTNAVFGQATTSLDVLRQTLTEAQIRQLAEDVTATATQALLGFTTPLSKAWQLGASARLTKVGGLPSVEVNGVVVPAQPATGDIYSYDAQLIGTNLYSKRDTSVLSATYLAAPAYDGYLLAYNNLTGLEQWTLEPSIRYYTQKDNLGVKLERWLPALRLTWQAHERVALESELSWEVTRTTGAFAEDRTTRGFFYVGYRWNY